MKMSLFLVLALLISVSSHAQSINFAGTYVSPHEVGALSYTNKKACEADKGDWRNGLCVFKSGDIVVIKDSVDGKFSISIESVGTNIHTCEFEGKAVSLNKVQLVSDQASTETVYNNETTEYDLADTTC